MGSSLCASRLSSRRSAAWRSACRPSRKKSARWKRLPTTATGGSLRCCRTPKISTLLRAWWPCCQNGKRVPLQVRRDGAGATRAENTLGWTSPFTLPDGGRGRLELQSQEDALGVRYSAMLTAETDLTVDAIEFVIDVPRLAFLKGRVMPDGSGPTELGPIKPPDPALFPGRDDRSALLKTPRAWVRSPSVSTEAAQRSQGWWIAGIPPEDRISFAPLYGRARGAAAQRQALSRR